MTPIEFEEIFLRLDWEWTMNADGEHAASGRPETYSEWKAAGFPGRKHWSVMQCALDAAHDEIYPPVIENETIAAKSKLARDSAMQSLELLKKG